MMIIVMSSWSYSAATNIRNCPSEVYPHTAAVNINRNEVFLNVQHPIRCNGTAIGWKVCYYLPAGGMWNEGFEMTYSVTVGVWRRRGGIQGIERYVLRHSEDIQLSEEAEYGQQGFNCKIIPLYYPYDMFDTQEGDVVGFYTTYVTSSQEVLNVMANTSQDAATQNWYVARRPTSGVCQHTPVSSLAVSCFGTDTLMRGYAMHVSLMVRLQQSKFVQNFMSMNYNRWLTQ